MNRSSISVAERHQEALDCIARTPRGDPACPSRSTDASGAFPPRIPLDDLTPAVLRGTIEASGCVLIPGLLSPELVAELVEGIDQAFDGYDRHAGANDTGDPWYDAFIPTPGVVHVTRPWLREGGGVLTGDSPVMIERWFGILELLGVVGLVADVFGERPVTSLDKCALRRIRSGDGIEWHQDGSFLGIESGALNLWVSLTDTTDAPGLDIVSRRFTEIV